MKAKTISFISLKGGVGKTTTTVGTALAMAEHFRKRVLVIDLDPQTNATIMLIGEKKWKELDSEDCTLHTLYHDIFWGENKFSLDRTIQKSVGNVKKAVSVDLLPSNLKMTYIQDHLVNIKVTGNYDQEPEDVLKNIKDKIQEQYDYILIDCPPNIGVLTLTGIRISDYYVIPTIPDYLSSFGIQQIINRVNTFSKETKCLGIVANKVKENSHSHRDIMNDLRLRKDAPLFKSYFPDNVKIAEAAELLGKMSFREKWGYRGQAEAFYKFTEELMERIEKDD